MMSSRETVEAEDESEELDPRVQEELEKLNSCTDEINRSILPSLILLYPNNQYLAVLPKWSLFRQKVLNRDLLTNQVLNGSLKA